MVHRTKKMTFRLTIEEYEKIKRKVEEAGISQQQFLLKTALGKEIVHINEWQSLMFQIKKIGININQIAKHGNETGIVSEDEISEVKEELKKIWQLINFPAASCGVFASASPSLFVASYGELNPKRLKQSKIHIQV